MFDTQHTLHASHDNTDEKAVKLINHFLKKRSQLYNVDSSLVPYWPAEFYGLDKSSLYRNATIDVQQNIVQQCAQDLLNESYFIEKIGIAYSAKLVLTASTTEVKQLFSFIGADEATHLQWIMSYVPQSLRTKPRGSLLSLINEIVSFNNENLLYYLVQVILEGWGIKHYKLLSQHCIDPQLKSIFERILQDEALHHQSGRSLFSIHLLTNNDLNIIKDILKAYCDLVRIGPQSIMQTVSKAMGGITKAQYVQLFDSLKGEKNAQEKLDTLFKLMNQPGLEKIVQEIKEEGYFIPYSPQRCAQVSLQSLAKV